MSGVMVSFEIEWGSRDCHGLAAERLIAWLQVIYMQTDVDVI